MARMTLIQRSAPLAAMAELFAAGVALTFGAELWLHGLHVANGVPQDWGHMLTEATVELPLVLLALWLTRAALRAFISRRPAAPPRLATGALFALGMAAATFLALFIDGLSTDLFYPELALTSTNPFLCTVFSVGVEAAVAIPGLGAAYDALVTLPAMLAIAAALVALRPIAPVAHGAPAWNPARSQN